MEQYSYHEETGKITLEKKAVQNSENAGKSIYLMSLDEFLSHPRKLVRKNNFIHSMTPIQYCKIEKYRECVQGTMRVPKGNKGQVCIHNFGFYLSEQELYLVEESHFLMEYLNKMAEGTYEGYSFRQILLALFEELLQDLAQQGLLASGAYVLFEHAAADAGAHPAGFETVREKRYGITSVDLLRWVGDDDGEGDSAGTDADNNDATTFQEDAHE